MEVNDGLLVAEVDGSYESFYEVTLDVVDIENHEAISCTCPRFDSGVYCKHIWAAILKFDSVFGNQTSSGASHKAKQVANSAPRTKAERRKLAPQWKKLLQNVAPSQWDRNQPKNKFPKLAKQTEEIHYVIDVSEGSRYEPVSIKLSVLNRVKKINGDWGKLKPLRLSHHLIDELADPNDRKIAAYLLGADRKYTDPYGYQSAPNSFSKFEIDSSWSVELCELLLSSGRLHWTLGMNLPVEDYHKLEFIDLKSPAEICVEISEQSKPKNSAKMEVSIQQSGKRLNNDDFLKISNSGIALLRNGLIRIDNPELTDLWTQVRVGPPIEILKADRNAFLKQLANIEGLPSIAIPDSWKIQQPETTKPTGLVRLHNAYRRENEFSGEVVFDYGGTKFPLSDSSRTIYDEESNCWSTRNQESENQLLLELNTFPITDTTHDQYADHDFRINKKHLGRIVDDLGSRGWKIQLLGKPIKYASDFDVSVESGQDWFDLSAKVAFDGETIALPSLLQAISRKEYFITLADGSQGRIPSQTIEKYARIAKFGQVEGDSIRFRPTQAMLLDAMLDAQEVTMDNGFRRFRKKLRSFSGIKPKSPPRGFKGTLRKYQAEGLAWLHFLREFKLGGCLADDMGLGKTIQVLTLLESRRIRRITKPDSKAAKTNSASPEPVSRKPKKDAEAAATIVTAAEALKRKPSIVVVPKSLIFNWIEEAAKFTPKLRILNYTGTGRKANVSEAVESGGFDVLITTYGTLRRDISDLSQIEFDYAILDESQAIKNSKAQCAKSSRLVRADHRLAMTGTPIENHLGELWSLFEFLNPGMLGGSTNFARLTNQKKSNENEREQTLDALSKAIAPFLLRRTKEQVLTDLPPKTEQTLYCDMLPAQKKAYKELKEYYRVKLAKKVETDGIGRSKIQVLEALLRLRQVACDPRLLDEKAKPGAKLELLQQQIAELVSEGHKVLVFSQFTSFLSLVKQQFDNDGIKYEYLDGKSSKRGASVKRFQENKSVSAFLISIKAGGHGLNLTAADYVFLLDPWWNPAVEAQAIDRAHRMGQQNPVIAYRMICRDTVEEKIVSLQQSKRDLADKIVRSDESLIRSLTADDLQILFE